MDITRDWDKIQQLLTQYQAGRILTTTRDMVLGLDALVPFAVNERGEASRDLFNPKYHSEYLPKAVDHFVLPAGAVGSICMTQDPEQSYAYDNGAFNRTWAYVFVPDYFGYVRGGEDGWNDWYAQIGSNRKLITPFRYVMQYSNYRHFVDDGILGPEMHQLVLYRPMDKFFKEGAR